MKTKIKKLEKKLEELRQELNEFKRPQSLRFRPEMKQRY